MQSGRGGPREAGPGKKMGRPEGRTIESKQTRIGIDALKLAEAEATRRGGKATARSVIEELIEKHLGGKD